MGLRKGRKQIYWERLRANRSKIVAANLSGINMLECYHLSAMSLPLSLTHTPRMVIPHCPTSDLAASHWNHTVRVHAAAHIKNSWTAESAGLWVDQYRNSHFCVFQLSPLCDTTFSLSSMLLLSPGLFPHILPCSFHAFHRGRKVCEPLQFWIQNLGAESVCV